MVRDIKKSVEVKGDLSVGCEVYVLANVPFSAALAFFSFLFASTSAASDSLTICPRPGSSTCHSFIRSLYTCHSFIRHSFAALDSGGGGSTEVGV